MTIFPTSLVESSGPLITCRKRRDEQCKRVGWEPFAGCGAKDEESTEQRYLDFYRVVYMVCKGVQREV